MNMNEGSVNETSLYYKSDQRNDEIQSKRDQSDRQMGKDDPKEMLSRYSEPFSLDHSPSSSVFESEELDSSNFESDVFEHESGVESFDGDWLQTMPSSDFELDLTEEQALETLKYFTLSVSRANQMTKTHQDLDAVLQLLQEKEKDLELAAHIGQSLLERNRSLYKKTELLENYVNDVEERETQLKHVVTMKDKLLKTFLEDEGVEEDSYSSSDSSPYESCRDESILSLQEKCDQLEASNANLVLEALRLREETDEEEEKEKKLVYECIKELGETKEQISHLTDEISQKTEDNMQQQEEISKLIDTVLELQQRHNHLTEENDELHETLKHSQENQKGLQAEVTTLHEKYQECYEMLMENQREMKLMKEKLGTQNVHGDSDSPSQGLRQDPRDSLAQEIEETVRRDLETSQEKRKHANRVMQTVRAANPAKRFPKAIKAGSRPPKAGQAKNADKPFDFTFAASANTSRSKESPSMDELRAAVRRLSISDNSLQGPRGRRSWAPEKLQIVKPMEGSATLHKWQSLARPTMSGLHNVMPGVHVKGEAAVKSENVASGASVTSDTVRPENKQGTVEAGKTNDEVESKSSANSEGKLNEKDNKIEDKKPKNENLTIVSRTTSPGEGSPTTGKPSQTSETEISTGAMSSNLTEIVKSQLSAENSKQPENETGSLLDKIFRSTAVISGSLVTSMPVTTTARTSFVPTTTTSTSTTVSAFPRPRHVRSRSSENLLDLIKPFNQQVSAESSTAAQSSGNLTDRLGSPGVPLEPPTQGFGAFVGRLVRSSSNENLAGTQNSELGFSRSSSSGKLSDLVKSSNLHATIGKASSFDATPRNKRASFTLGDSPPSPSQLEMLGDLGGFAFFGPSPSSTPAAVSSSTTGPSVAASSSKSVFGALSGLGGFFRQRSKSMDNLFPLPSDFSAPSPSVNRNSGRASRVERSLERFNQVFGPD